jgi:phage major head subunit gpT-like protein
VSETQPTSEANYPWSQALVGGGKNRPAAYGALNQANIQEGIIALMNQKNLQGIKMMVKPTRLLIGPKLSFDAAVLMNSSYYPSGAAAAGNVGGAFAINPLKSILDITVSRFMPKNDGTMDGDSKAWYIVDDTHPWFVLQLREAISLKQENPDAGQSFDFDVIRWKARMRGNADFIDPRFAWQGNDGSV